MTQFDAGVDALGKAVHEIVQAWQESRDLDQGHPDLELNWDVIRSRVADLCMMLITGSVTVSVVKAKGKVATKVKQEFDCACGVCVCLCLFWPLALPLSFGNALATHRRHCRAKALPLSPCKALQRHCQEFNELIFGCRRSTESTNSWKPSKTASAVPISLLWQLWPKSPRSSPRRTRRAIIPRTPGSPRRGAQPRLLLV